MNYEQKYKEALEKARQFSERPLEEDSSSIVEYIFPELKEESEDEKVKRILHSISSKMSFHLRDIFTEEEFQCFDVWSNAWLEKQGTSYTKRDVDDAFVEGIALTKYELEKQGEKKTINQPDFEIPFGAKDSELIEESYYIPKGYHAEISKDKVTIKNGEQKPVEWSEEDEMITLSIKQIVTCASFLNIVPETLDKIDKWLNSLKQRIEE